MKAKIQPANQQLANTDYASRLVDLKQRVRMTQLRAAVRVNTELIQLYLAIALLSHNFSEQRKLRIHNGFSHLGHEIIVENFV